MFNEGIAIVSILVILIFGIIVTIVYDGDQWAEFTANHHCKVVSESSSTMSLGIGVGTKGGGAVVPIVTPGQTGYLCDDGITYYR